MDHDEVPEVEELDPYETLGVERAATAAEIRSAYRKLALTTHPDKAKPEDREAAHDKFRQLALAYAVLSDERRRRRYDATGSTRESALDDDDFDWASFFRDQFAKVSFEAVERFKKEYQGSEEERDAVLAAYENSEGSLDAIFEEVMVSNPLDDEVRFREIIDKAIKEGAVQAYPAYTKETKASRKRRRDNASKEVTEAMQYAKELGVDDKLFKGKGKNKAEGDTSALEALIKSRNANRMDSLIDSLEAKYTKGRSKAKSKRGAGSELDEEAFLKAREKVDARKQAGGTKRRKQA